MTSNKFWDPSNIVGDDLFLLPETLQVKELPLVYDEVLGRRVVLSTSSRELERSQVVFEADQYGCWGPPNFTVIGCALSPGNIPTRFGASSEREYENDIRVHMSLVPDRRTPPLMSGPVPLHSLATMLFRDLVMVTQAGQQFQLEFSLLPSRCRLQRVGGLVIGIPFAGLVAL